MTDRHKQLKWCSPIFKYVQPCRAEGVCQVFRCIWCVFISTGSLWSLWLHVCACVHALLSYCPLHVPQLLPAWATDSQTQHWRGREHLSRLQGQCWSLLCSTLLEMIVLWCWSWLADAAVSHPGSFLMLLPIPVNKFCSLVPAGRRVGAAATRHQCLWNEVKREVSPQPDPFVFMHNHSHCSNAFLYSDTGLHKWPTLLGVMPNRLMLLYNDILICTNVYGGRQHIGEACVVVMHVECSKQDRCDLSINSYWHKSCMFKYQFIPSCSLIHTWQQIFMVAWDLMYQNKGFLFASQLSPTFTGSVLAKKLTVKVQSFQNPSEISCVSSTWAC